MANEVYITPELSPAVLNRTLVVDVSDKTNPVILTTLSYGLSLFNGSLNSGFKSGSRFYQIGIHNGVGGRLRIWDVSIPSVPVLLSTFEDAVLGVTAVTVNTANTVACVLSEGSSYFHTLDVSNPALPSITAFWDLTALRPFAIPQLQPTKCLLDGTTFYIVSEQDGVGDHEQLGIYDVSNPLAVIQSSVLSLQAGTASACSELHKVGSLLFFATELLTKVWIIDVSNPLIPTVVATLPIASSAIAVSPTRLVIDEAGLVSPTTVDLYDITTPAVPSLIQAISVPGTGAFLGGNMDDSNLFCYFTSSFFGVFAVA